MKQKIEGNVKPYHLKTLLGYIQFSLKIKKLTNYE